jgi:hypothetical protein
VIVWVGLWLGLWLGRYGVIVWMGLRLGLWLGRHGLLVVEVLQEMLLDWPAQSHGRTLWRRCGSLDAGDDTVGGALGDRDDLGRLLARARSVGGSIVELREAVGAVEVGGERHAEGAGTV